MNHVLVTGCAGFIGFHVVRRLLDQGITVYGMDNLNPYYDVTLKKARLAILKEHANFNMHVGDIADQSFVMPFFKNHGHITHIVHLAAQAGVRYSIEDPYSYAHSNFLGQMTLLEGVRHLQHLQHFVYASSSSVYGANQKLPFSVDDPVEQPMAVYAVSKRACELLSHSYSHLYRFPQTGLRFFTVYGPWGRPDMAAFIFVKGILEGAEVPVYNKGDMRRNFTYIDDIVEGVLGCLPKPPSPNDPGVPHRLYNLGNNRSENLMDFIHTLEKHVGKSARIRFEPLQPGDVPDTIADIAATQRDFNFQPQTNIDEGLGHFVRWYRDYYRV